MIKFTVYPKTTRYNESEKGYIITEKLDGSNLGIGRIGEQIYICQRNYVLSLEEVQHGNNAVYKGLTKFCREYGDKLKELIYDGSIIFGEWLGMGKLKYLHLEEFKNRFYIFAKGRISLNEYTNTLDLTNLVYDLDLLHYAFNNQEIPEFISVVPIVMELSEVGLLTLDTLYAIHCKDVNRKVEGFIIYDKNSKTIRKYIRYNREGKLVPHKETGGK